MSIYSITFHPHPRLMEVGVVIALLQMKKLKCKEDKQLGKGA